MSNYNNYIDITPPARTKSHRTRIKESRAKRNISRFFEVTPVGVRARRGGIKDRNLRHWREVSAQSAIAYL